VQAVTRFKVPGATAGDVPVSVPDRIVRQGTSRSLTDKLPGRSAALPLISTAICKQVIFRPDAVR